MEVSKVNEPSSSIPSRTECLNFAIDSTRISTTKSDGCTYSSESNGTKKTLLDGAKSSTLPPSTTSPSSKSDSDNSNSGQTNHHFMGTFDSIRKKFKGLTENHQKNKNFEDQPETGRGREKQLKTKQKERTRSRSTSKLKVATLNKTNVSRAKKINASKNLISIKNSTVLNQPSTSRSRDKSQWKVQDQQLPPTPPLHRITSVVS